MNLPIDPDNWETITDGMAQVTQPGYFHTAGSAHLEGIDLAGKTGTAQVMSHQALDKTNKGHHTLPNVWFVGVVPRRNPELVVAVLWEHGEFSYYPARLGARFVAAYVEKQRRLANNLMPVKAPNPPPVEVGAVWTTPNPAAGRARRAGNEDAGGQVLCWCEWSSDRSARKPATASKTAPEVNGSRRIVAQGGARQPSTPDRSAQLRTSKPATAPSESAKLSTQPALAGKTRQVKSQ